jgi:hypothetical protein
MSSRNSFRSLLCVGLWLAFLIPHLAFAQTVKSTAPAAVLASASAEQTRFTALGETIEMRLEIFSLTGEQLYDSDFKLGNLLDWNLLDQQGQHLLDGSYRCLVTTKTLAGQLSQKHGLIVLQTGQATLQTPDQEALTVNAAAPLRREDFLTIVGAGTNWPLTLLAHDGERARLVSGRGGLSFRTGDFFTGKEQEQMQLTPDGKLGLGVVEPQAKLDVGGLIRTAEGIVFPDGSIQTTAYVAASRSLDGRARTQRDAQGRALAAADEPEKLAASENKAQLAPNISGSGTTNRLTKWTNGPNGVVGDSVITEVGGNVGIGNAAPPSSGLHLEKNGDSSRIRLRSYGGQGILFGERANGSLATPTALASGNQIFFFGAGGYDGTAFKANAAAGLRVIAAQNWSASGHGSYITLETTTNGATSNAERLRIDHNGNVGIGTTTPGFPLTFPNTLGDKISLWGQSGNHYGFGIQGGLLQIHSGSSGDDIAFGYGTSDAFSETMRIKGTGNVGIGTNNPGYLLDVANRMRVRQAGGNSAGIWFYQTTPAADRAFVGMNTDTKVGFYGNTGAGWGMLMDTSTGNVTIGTTDSPPAKLYTYAEGSLGIVGASNATDGVGVRGVASNGGSLSYGVSGISNNGHGVSGSSLDGTGVSGFSNNGKGVSGSSANGYAGYFTGNVHVTGTFTNPSDARLKQDVLDLNYGLREVLQLRPVTWHWKDKPAGKLQLGLIAQEAQRVLPELVSEGKDPEKTLSLNYLGLTPVLVKAIQEQQTALEQKEADIKALQQRNADLEARLAALEQTLQQLLGQPQPAKRQ